MNLREQFYRTPESFGDKEDAALLMARMLLEEENLQKLQDLVETAKAHIRAKGEHPFRVIKQQFGFQKTRLRGMVKNRCKVNVLAALTNLFLARRQLLATP